MTGRRQGDDDLVAAARAVGQSHHRVQAAFAQRGTNETAWRDAAAQARHDVLALESRLADIEARLRANDTKAIDAALVFLEADPWGFRSGYAKERLLRRIRPLVMSAAQEQRCVDVVKTWTAGRPRREFRQLTRLARRFDSALHPWALEQLQAARPATRRHALWLLFALPGPVADAQSQADVRRALVDSCTGDPALWRRDAWLRQAVRQVWSAEWGNELVQRALGPDELRVGELRLLGHAVAAQPLTAEQQQRLRRAIIEDVAADRLRLPFEALATWVADDVLRDEAETVRAGSDPRAAQRAAWVVRAITIARAERWTL